MATEPALVTARRFDRGGELLRGSFKRGSDGALLCEGIASREGVLEYVRADGSIRRELVTRQAVEDTARTCPRSPVTLNHPDEGFVSPDTHERLNVGDVDGEGAVEESAQGGYVKVKLAVRARRALDAIDSGVDQLSFGYNVTLDETPGEHPVFGRYDARQIARDGNHLAIVPRGRAGPTVRLRADSADAYQRIDDATPHREDPMNLLALLAALGVPRSDSEGAMLAAGIEAVNKLKADASARADAAAELNTVRADNATLKQQNTALKDDIAKKTADLAAKQGECDAMKAELDAMKKAEADRKDAAELARLEGLAKKLDVKTDGLDLPKLRVAIAKTRVDSIDEKSPAPYVDGVLATIEAGLKGRSDGGDGRWDFGRRDGAEGNGGERRDGADANQRRDSHWHPDLERADKARDAASRSATPRTQETAR